MKKTLYKVEINNKITYQSNSITECINECLKHIDGSFKVFNSNNYALICVGNKIVWNSRLATN
jgi:hypothetical protein